VANRILFIVKSLYTMERLGIMYMASAAASRSWQTSLLIADEQEEEALIAEVKRQDPQILGFSCMSPEYPKLARLARLLRAETKACVLFGGPHPTFFQGIIEETFIDAVAFGEGDISFGLFLDRYPAHPLKTPGFHFRTKKGVVRNPPAPFVHDLDLIAFPDRELLLRAKPSLRHSRTHLFMASRGCPNECAYCFNHSYNEMFKTAGKVFRRRSVDNLIREMRQTRDRYGTRFAYIDDDIFTLCNVSWLEEFASRYPAEVGVPFMCNLHVKATNQRKVRLLKQAGCGLVCFGIECGDQSVSRMLLKRNVTNEEFDEMARLLQEYDIRFVTQNLMALPTPNPLEVDLRTLDLNIRCKPQYAVAHLFFPLPGTDLAKFAEEEGYYDPRRDCLPEGTNTFSALRFADPKEKARVERLHKIFALVVSFPFLRPLVPTLIRLPLGKLYYLVSVAWYGFSLRVRLERTGKSWREMLIFAESLVSHLFSVFKWQRRRLKAGSTCDDGR
jgi:anaerobic magnesium-protoporphyrin IX monomethyl ester cyclase